MPVFDRSKSEQRYNARSEKDVRKPRNDYDTESQIVIDDTDEDLGSILDELES